MKEKFEQLITGFCAGAKLADPAKIMNGAPFETGGVVFSLCYGKSASGSLLIYTDFGPVPAYNKKPVYYMLLEENFIAAIGAAGSFGISSATGNVVYTEQVSLEGMSPQKLHEKFRSLSEEARIWRAKHFIGDLSLPVPRTRPALNRSVKV